MKKEKKIISKFEFKLRPKFSFIQQGKKERKMKVKRVILQPQVQG